MPSRTPFRLTAKRAVILVAALILFPLVILPLSRFVLFPLSKCGEPLAKGSIPDTLVAGIISQEDGLFFNHFGVDWGQVEKAAQSNVKRRKVGRGASTIDMQVAGLCYLNRAGRSSFFEKWQELVLATAMNVVYDKAEILRAYLSKAPMNPDKSVEGFAAASRYYYKTELKNLSNAQELKLVATLRSRSLFNPKVFDKNMRGIHLRVLRRVEREQYPVKMAIRQRIKGYDFIWVRKYLPPPPPPLSDPREEATDEEMNRAFDAHSEPEPDAAPTPADPVGDQLNDQVNVRSEGQPEETSLPDPTDEFTPERLSPDQN